MLVRFVGGNLAGESFEMNSPEMISCDRNERGEITTLFHYRCKDGLGNLFKVGAPHHEQERVDILCPSCWCPSVWRVREFELHDDGVDSGPNWDNLVCDSEGCGWRVRADSYRP